MSAPWTQQPQQPPAQGQPPWAQQPPPNWGQQPPQNWNQPNNGAVVQNPWEQAPQQQPPTQQQPQNDEGDDSFFTGGVFGSYMSFGDDRCVGYERGGEIVNIGERQQTDQKTSEPQFWPNSDRPIMIKTVTLQTQEREPNNPDDQGLRTVWLPQSRDITKAVTDALKLASPNEVRLKLGGQLWITRTGSRQTTQKDGKKGNPAFTYKARYVPPNPSRTAVTDDFFTGQQGNGPQQVQQAAAQVATADTNGQPAPWQQGAPPQQQPAWAQQPAPQQGQAPWQQQPAAQPQGQPPWAQQPQQQGYQPAAPDPSNPWGNQPQQGQAPWQQGAPPQQQPAPQQGQPPWAQQPAPQQGQAPWQQ
jgi:hypothetical protein